MFSVHTILGRKGPLSTVWVACHTPQRVTKKQVMETNIRQATSLILGNDKIKCSLPVLGDLLIGLVELSKRRIDYMDEHLEDKLNELDKMITVERESVRHLSTNQHESANERYFPPVIECADLELNLPAEFSQHIREQQVNQARVYKRITLKQLPRETAAAAAPVATGNETDPLVFDGFGYMSASDGNLDHLGDQLQGQPNCKANVYRVPPPELVLEPLSEEENPRPPRFIPPPRPARSDGPPPTRRRRFDNLTLDVETQIDISSAFAPIPGQDGGPFFSLSNTLQAHYNRVFEVATGRLHVPIEDDVPSRSGSPPSSPASVHSSTHHGDDQFQEPEDGEDYIDEQISSSTDSESESSVTEDDEMSDSSSTPSSDTDLDQDEYLQNPPLGQSLDPNYEQLENEISEKLDRSIAAIPRGVTRTFSDLVGPNSTSISAAGMFSSLLKAPEWIVDLSQEESINLKRFFDIIIDRIELASPDI